MNSLVLDKFATYRILQYFYKTGTMLRERLQ